MNQSVNLDVFLNMVAVSKGELTLELARQKIGWVDIIPWPLHVDADAKKCLEFVKKDAPILYKRIIPAMARLHHAYFDALGGIDNVCIIAQSSITRSSKYKNVFRHVFAEVETHCETSLSFGPIERFGFKAHACSFLGALYPGAECLKMGDAELAYAYALVFGTYVKVNAGASAKARDGPGWDVVQASRRISASLGGRAARDKGVGFFAPAINPDNPGAKTTYASLGGRKACTQGSKFADLPALVVPAGCVCPSSKCKVPFTRGMAATIKIYKKNCVNKWTCSISCPVCPQRRRDIKSDKSLNKVFEGQPEALLKFRGQMHERGKRELDASEQAPLVQQQPVVNKQLAPPPVPKQPLQIAAPPIPVHQIANTPVDTSGMASRRERVLFRENRGNIG